MKWAEVFETQSNLSVAMVPTSANTNSASNNSALHKSIALLPGVKARKLTSSTGIATNTSLHRATHQTQFTLFLKAREREKRREGENEEKSGKDGRRVLNGGREGAKEEEREAGGWEGAEKRREGGRERGREGWSGGKKGESEGGRIEEKRDGAVGRREGGRKGLRHKLKLTTNTDCTENGIEIVHLTVRATSKRFLLT